MWCASLAPSARGSSNRRTQMAINMGRGKAQSLRCFSMFASRPAGKIPVMRGTVQCHLILTVHWHQQTTIRLPRTAKLVLQHT
ncbi:hypothetical protein ABBQ38_006796 [Trebouxia sp. C0009 RCD-2024]